MMQRFTDDAQRVLSLAQEAALELGHDYVGTEHVLIGLTKVKNGVAAKALEELGLVTEDIFEAVEEHVGRGNKKATSIYMTPRVKHVLELAIQVANQMNHNYVGTEHILLGLLSDGSGVAVAILRAMNIRSNDVVEAIRSILGSNKGSNNGGQEGINSNNDLGELSDFATDLNESAKQGKIDPVIGRDTEIQRVIQILSRRTKNNPVLIGEPGVGKTAIAEGLAQRIVTGNVPEILRNKRIISLSIGSMLAGAKYRGEFEERLKKAIDEVQQHDDMIIFIDEIDKVATNNQNSGQDVSRQGVQRDILPILEGSMIQTKYGTVNTEHMLFIGAGAFHVSKPSDLIPELQGRFPIRVELESLSVDDFVRILTEPKLSLIKQYEALLQTEEVTVNFTEEAVKRLAEIAYQVNQDTDNIGARRLHTILEKMLEDLSFEAPNMPHAVVDITPQYVDDKLKTISTNKDLSAFIL